MTLLLENETDNEQYVKELDTYIDAKDWIANHLDLSKKWSVTDIGNENNALYTFYKNGGKFL